MSDAEVERSPVESGDDLIVDDDDGEFDDGFFDELEEGGLAEVGDFFSEERLQELVGTKDIEGVTFLEVRINSEEIVMRDLGGRLPNLSELKLNNSNVASMRDLGTSFKNLTVLWLARSNVQDLDGVGALDSIKELYLAFNEVKDLSALVGCDSLEVLDLEGNIIDDIGEVQFLSSCDKLRELTLDGNPIANSETYRDEVCRSLPQIEMLDDIGRDEALRAGGAGGDDDEAGSPEGGGGLDFALNVTTEDDAAEYSRSQTEEDEVRPRTAAKLSPSKKTDKDVEELMLVHKGIKHARTGFDDVDFVSLQDCAEEMVDTRPASAMRKASSSGSLRPASAAGSASRGAAASPAESIESIESAESGRVVYRPGSAGSGGQRRPGTATSGGSGRRPTTASMSVRQGSGAARPRPGTSSMRPRTAALGFGARPGTGGGLRPGTAASSRPSTAGGGDHAWAFRRSARSSKSGVDEDDQGGEVASDLTYGSEEVYCGNLARGLRRRNVTQMAEKYNGKEEVFTELSCDDILAELRRWKTETINLALGPEEDFSPIEYKEGEVMGTGDGDRLILGEEDEADEVQLRGGKGRGTGTNHADLLGEFGSPGVEEDEEEDEDAEELLRRLQEQNERSWSRLGAAADAMDADQSSNSDTESQAPTARSSTATSSIRAKVQTLQKPGASEDGAAASSPLGSPSGRYSERYRRPTVAPSIAQRTEAPAPEFGTSGSSSAAPPPRRPTPTIRAPTVRRKPAEGADSSGVMSFGGASGAENAAPSGADNKFRIARARVGSTALAGDGNALATGGAFGVPAAGTAAGVPFGGANSLLAKSRGVGALVGPGSRSPMVNSPIRAASPLVSEGNANFPAPTPPRDDPPRPASGVRRAPVRPMTIPTAAE